MDIKNNIIITELEFPKVFIHFICKKYGLLFYNENNKSSYDSNHAILYADKLDNLDAVLDDYCHILLTKRYYPKNL